MIAACPKCQTRYRLKPEQIGERGIRLRCRRCEALFRVLPPPSADPTAAASRAAAPIATPAAQPETPVAPPPAEAAPSAPAEATGPPALLVALPGEEGKRMADRFCIDGQRAVAVGDAAEALLTMHRNPPRAAILDAALAGIGGHALCEIMKRSPLLEAVRVLLLQGADAPSRDSAADGFGADLYLDRARGEEECDAALVQALTQWDLAVPPPVSTPTAPPEGFDASPNSPGGIPAAPVMPPPSVETPPVPAMRSPSVETPAAPAMPSAAATGATEEEAEEIARAERLARIAVSDIVLYNEEKFAAALRSEDPLLAMRDEVEDGRALLRGRIAETVFGQRDFVGDELLRLVRERA